MSDFLFALNTVLPLLLLMSLGWFCRRVGLLTETLVKGVNQLVFKVFLPVSLCVSVMNTPYDTAISVNAFLLAAIGLAADFGILFLLIPRIEKEGYRYFFAYEESIGCAPGEKVRDKDGICAGLLMMEMAAFYKKKGLTLTDALDALYSKYGCFAERQFSLVRTGQAGAEEIASIMQKARDEKPDHFGTWKVADATDYLHGWQDIPASNVLKFRMENGDWFAMRPSGTEPKLKFYFYTKAGSREAALQSAELLEKTVIAQLS